jgi:hypothetical protein
MGNWKDVIRGIAPALGAALLGPQVGAAIGVLGEKLLGRKYAAESEVQAYIEAGLKPEDELKLREADHAFTLSLLDKVSAAEAIDATDRASAREREKSLKDWTPQALACLTFGAFFTLLFLMAAHAVPASNQQAMNLLLGVLAGAVTQVLNYYFGSSSGSAAARDVIGRIAEKGKA